MVTIELTPSQYTLLGDLALEERKAIRGAWEFKDEEEQEEATKRFNELATIFGLELWSLEQLTK